MGNKCLNDFFNYCSGQPTPGDTPTTSIIGLGYGGTKDEDFAEYYSMRLPVKIETQEEAKIAFNYKYLCDAVKPFSVCNLELTSLSSPGKFTGDIEGLTIVVMPMFVQW